MKKLCVILSLIVILADIAQAESVSAAKDDTGRSGFSKHGNGQSPVTRSPIKVDKLPARPTGMFYEMAEHGFIVIDPTAPPSEGYGQRFLTTNPFPGSVADHRQDAAHEFGGIVFIGFGF